MKEVKDAISVLEQFALVQSQLCALLVEKYGVIEDVLLFNIPRSGLLVLNDESWLFQKHGAGVRFQNAASAAVVDAHTHMQSHPACFDTWRLVQYFQSKRISLLNCGVVMFDVTEEQHIAEMLSELSIKELVVRLRETEVFILAQ